tara:strand:- start:583 stop:759 length:177 start_codon:yes stop_codon:yes gene_type:complete
MIPFLDLKGVQRSNPDYIVEVVSDVVKSECYILGEVRSNLTINGYTGKVMDIKPMNTG